MDSWSNGRFEIFVSNTRIHNNHSNSSIYFQIRNEINKLDFSNVDFSDNIGNSLLLHDDDRVENGSPGSTSPDLVISEAIFSNCTFNRNQDIDTISFNSKSAKFDNCLFKKNSADVNINLVRSSDAKSYNLHEITLDNVQFLENYGISLDAPIYTKVIVSDSEFVGNNESAIKAEHQVAVTNSIFQDLNDSAISMDGSAGFVEVRDSSFINNHSSNNGGAIFCKKINVANCIFRENYAKNAGGAIYLDPVNIKFDDFEEHERPVDHIHNCIFDSNIAGFEGGGICAYNPSYVKNPCS